MFTGSDTTAHVSGKGLTWLATSQLSIRHLIILGGGG